MYSVCDTKAWRRVTDRELDTAAFDRVLLWTFPGLEKAMRIL